MPTRREVLPSRSVLRDQIGHLIVSPFRTDPNNSLSPSGPFAILTTTNPATTNDLLPTPPIGGHLALCRQVGTFNLRSLGAFGSKIQPSPRISFSFPKLLHSVPSFKKHDQATADGTGCPTPRSDSSYREGPKKPVEAGLLSSGIKSVI